ncbi:MAG: EAL domain-containing protein [Hyphomonadaceae bacterium]
MTSAFSSFEKLKKSVSIFMAPDIPSEVAGSIRAKQLASVTGLVPAIMMAQLINAAVVLIAFWSSGAEGLLGLWATALCLICGVTMLGSVKGKRIKEKQTRSRRSMEKMSRRSAFLGLIWGVVPIIIVPYSDPLGHMALGIVMAAMGFAGGFLLGRIPQAAYAFIGPLMLGHIVGLQIIGTPVYDLLSILTLVYTGILIVCVQWSHARYVEQLLGEAALIEQEQVISLLLRDFEETTSDWLWQTDEDGRLQGLQDGLQVNKAQYDIMQQGMELTELFHACESRDVLETSLKRRSAFRDLVMCVEASDGEAWWLLTGKPVFENGFFAGFRGVASDVTASKLSEDRIAHLAHYDDLTGLPNRVTMLERLEKEVRAPVRPGYLRALLWLDLDNFKWVNDTLGHPAGDALLRMVADRLHEHCQPSDAIARLGGDEFAVSIERKGGIAEIEEFISGLSKELSKAYNLKGSAARCSASIGVRVFDATLTDARTLLKHADLALYKAKSNGKSGWCMFSNDLEEEAQRRRDVELDLQRAIENNELVVYFQPQVDAKTRELVGCEALLRWVHPTKGLIYPGEFIEAAEDSGLITRLGDWVIRAALENAKRFPDHVRIAVNISPLQVHSANLFPTIVQALARNQLDPSRLDLEITESVLMTDTDFTIDRLHQLKALGVRISLDDFGTGFSSLSYLRNFPFDKIKIDKSFISDMETSEDSRAITVATLGLAKALGLRCTAEGVETEFQSKFLSDHGCDELQGFFISRAQPVEKLKYFVDMETSIPQRSQTTIGRIVPGPSLVALNDTDEEEKEPDEDKRSEAG